MAKQETFEQGTLVLITNPKSGRYGQKGIVHTTGIKTGYYIKFEDGMSYVPYGVERVKEG